MKTARTFVVCALATLAVGATLASGASAANFKAGEYPAEVEGTQKGEAVLLIENKLKLICKEGTSAGELKAEAETLAVEPTYKSCTFNGQAATFAAEGCTYVLYAGAEPMNISCPAGKVMKMKTATCEVQIDSQQQLTKVSYAMGGVPSIVTATKAVGQITYDRTLDGFLCPLEEKGLLENGQLTEVTELEAIKNEVNVGLTIG